MKSFPVHYQNESCYMISINLLVGNGHLIVQCILYPITYNCIWSIAWSNDKSNKLLVKL